MPDQKEQGVCWAYSSLAGLRLPGRPTTPLLSPSSAVYLWLDPQSSHLHPEASSHTVLLHMDTRVCEGLTCLKVPQAQEPLVLYSERWIRGQLRRPRYRLQQIPSEAFH